VRVAGGNTIELGWNQTCHHRDIDTTADGFKAWVCFQRRARDIKIGSGYHSCCCRCYSNQMYLLTSADISRLNCPNPRGWNAHYWTYCQSNSKLG
jgi:hypothetical protein